jgi:monofunctional biosynthetic peptidoglycan transglycosylase
LGPNTAGWLLVKALFRLGVFGDGGATPDYLDELGTIMIHKILALILLILMGAFVKADDAPHKLFNFTVADAAKEWQAVNDGVMGGISEGTFRITDKRTMEFFGNLSLENNGGFASVRTKARKLGLEKGDTLVAKVRGDGRQYMLNLYLNKPLIAFSYRATIQTSKDEWIEVKIPLTKFEATSFGRVVKDAGSVKAEEVNSLGFMLSDKKAGPFRLEVESVRVERGGK